jgi:predicted nuclease of predicted toxin-antitoxin system
MKGFLFDENLPARLTFEPGLPVASTTVLGHSPTDTQVWEHARREQLVIVTKDADFSGRIILSTPPPWVVHLRFGNLRRRDFHALLSRVWPQVRTLLKSHKLVNVHADRVEGVS